MTPKEKAEELVNAIENKTHSLVKDEEAKICALIAVDEVLNFIYTDAFSYTNEEYWQQVKQEIEKL